MARAAQSATTARTQSIAILPAFWLPNLNRLLNVGKAGHAREQA
jgi:hypothetical protein